jgi:preprotein translocase subunit SecA
MGERLRDDILDMVRDVAAKITQQYYPDGDREGLQNEVRTRFLADLKLSPEQFQSLGEDGVAAEVVKSAEEFYRRKEEKIGPAMMGTLEKMAMLQVIDAKWRDHLREMDDLKEGIHLRGYGQKDPLVEYKGEAFKMFMTLMEIVADEVVNVVFKFFPERIDQLPAQRGRRSLRREDLVMSHESALGAGFDGSREAVPASGGEPMQAGPRPQKIQPVRVAEKVGRNDPCPCGSGKKYKNCHGSS